MTKDQGWPVARWQAWMNDVESEEYEQMATRIAELYAEMGGLADRMKRLRNRCIGRRGRHNKRMAKARRSRTD